MASLHVGHNELINQESTHINKTRTMWSCFVPSSLYHKMRLCRQLNCWSIICSWSIACRRCSNYIFILHLSPGFNMLHKDNCKPIREAFQFLDLVSYIRDFTVYWFPVTQIPQYTIPISNSAPLCVLWDICLIHCGICETHHYVMYLILCDLKYDLCHLCKCHTLCSIIL